MSANINLLLRTDEESLKKKKRIKIFNFISVAFLVAVGLASVIIFMLIQVFDPLSVKKEQSDVLKKISQFQDRRLKLLVLNDRVENIEKILKIRRDISKELNSLLSKIPSQLSIDGINIDNKSVVINGQSKSLFVIGEFINNLTDMVRKKEVIKSLTLNSISMNENTNTYQISVQSEL